MRIERITTAVVEANYDWTIVRIESDQGVCGWGEAFCAPGLTQTIRELASLLEGADARQVEPLVRKLYLATAHVSSGGTVYHAISGIEAALWDLAARSLEVPLWQLFGGRFRDRVRIYADCHAGEALTSYSAILVSRRLPWMETPADDFEDAEPEVHWAPEETTDVYTPEAYVARAEEMADRGFTALKFDLDLPLLPHEDLYARTISGAQLERQVALAEATVAAVAGRAEVAFDLHWRYAPADALRLACALEHLPLLWLEDPTPAQDLESIARISERTTTPICTGENLYRLDGFAALIDRGGVDILAPDIQKVGGLSDTRPDRGIWRRPLSAARPAQHLRADRHARLGARLRVDPELPRPRVACSVGSVLRRARNPRPALIVDGYVALPDGPGIDTEPELAACRRYARPGEPFFDEPAVD
jgi:L-alanine-DL-glutamate epimerase-like enolase superfamily enzyme